MTDHDDGQSVQAGDLDDAELEASGYQREMPRQFSMLSLLALAYALICTWNGFGSALGTGLRDASSSGSIFMLLPAGLMIGIVSLGMAELCSAFPVAGAQYYWSFVLSTPEWAPFASYSTAVISVIGYWLGGASTCNFISGMILSIVQFINPEYEIQSWHKYLCYIAIIWLAVLLNILGSRLLPLFNKLLFYFSLTTFALSFTAILAGAYPNYQSPKWVFTDHKNSNGLSDNGPGWLFCFVNALYGFLGTDAGAHMTEEIPNPSVNGPKVILYPVLIGFVTVIPFAIACMFCIQDMDAILNSPSGLPLIQLYSQATRSPAMTVVLMVAFTICFFGCGVANITGASRQVWSAARDDCFPLSKYLKAVSPRWEMPLNAVLVQGVFASVYGLIFLGSEIAFASMVSASIIFIVGSYVIPQGILAWRGRDKLLPDRAFDLGCWGFTVNTVSAVWTFFLIILCCLPTHYPVKKENMNYNSIVATFLLLLTWLGWVYSRRGVFEGPVVDKKLLIETRKQQLGKNTNGPNDRTPLL